jgi:L,D-transpeptidase ErfK/SrfK
MRPAKSSDTPMFESLTGNLNSLLGLNHFFVKTGLVFSRLPYKKMLDVSGYVAGMLVLLFLVLFMIPALQELTIPGAESNPKMPSGENTRILEKQVTDLNKSISGLEKKINSFTPRSPFLVISTSENRFYLYNNRKLYREGECSTGSYILLEAENRQKWMFRTPKGKFRIQGKTTTPVWKKPDWAFVEQGMPIPPENHYSRFEYGVLGDYALSLGDGYLIHGTLYKRFLGLPVTHGCVRLNDEDLEVLYNMLQVGSRVYIY